MKKFNDLVFNSHPAGFGKQALIFFDNGFGVSVVKHPFSLGKKQGLYELAVITGDKDNISLNFSTPITDGLLGYLSENDVTEIMEKVQRLTPFKKEK